MQTIQRVGPYVQIIEARSPENPLNVVKLGVSELSSERFIDTNQSIKCAQLYGIIQPGLTEARHAFKGLNRHLMNADNTEADKTFVAYSWKPQFDFVWGRGRFNGNPIPRKPPSNQVFVVVIKLLTEPEHYPGHGEIAGSVEHWSWISEDPGLEHAPVDWAERYDGKLWSR